MQSQCYTLQNKNVNPNKNECAIWRIASVVKTTANSNSLCSVTMYSVHIVFSYDVQCSRATKKRDSVVFFYTELCNTVVSS